MKKVLFTALLTLCSCGTEKRTEEAILWINSHDKPIIVIKHSTNGLNLNDRYTLIDDNSKVYSTGEILLRLPDTLKKPN